MPISYAWEFNPLDVRLSENGLTNVVYSVNWRLTGTDGDYTATVYGAVTVPAPDPANFTPYDQLSEAQVQGWVTGILGAEQVAVYESSVAEQIAVQKNPVEASLPPPWS